MLFKSRRVITADGITPGLGFQVATPDAIKAKRAELEDFVRRLAAARAWSQTNVEGYAATWGRLMNIPPAVPRNWLTRARIRIAPIDDSVVADEQKTIDLYDRWGLIRHKINAADIVDRSFGAAVEKGAGL
ncbi:ABC-type nitrate/sulfonate/bicarbonate transport system substrate-binding protein [Bradyrhizobium sp. USDA 3364]